MNLFIRTLSLVKLGETLLSVVIIAASCLVMMHYLPRVIDPYERYCTDCNYCLIAYGLCNTTVLGFINGFALSVPFILVLHHVIFHRFGKKPLLGEYLGCAPILIQISLIAPEKITILANYIGNDLGILIVLLQLFSWGLFCLCATCYFVVGVLQLLVKQDPFILKWPNNFATITCMLSIFLLNLLIFMSISFP